MHGIGAVDLRLLHVSHALLRGVLQRILSALLHDGECVDDGDRRVIFHHEDEKSFSHRKQDFLLQSEILHSAWFMEDFLLLRSLLL